MTLERHIAQVWNTFVTGGFTNQGPTVSAPPNLPMDGPYDQAYFKKWIDSLQAKLQPPDIHSEQAFLDACQAVQSANQAKCDAEKLCDQLSKQKPVNQQELDKAKAAVEATTNALNNVLETCCIIGVDLLDTKFQEILADDYDDSDLVTFVVLKQAGAKHLADWCQKGDRQTSQLLGLLHNVDLQRQFLQAGGARKGEYGPAMELYSTITPPDNPVLQRLAMAVALELASPLAQFGSSSKFIDPVQRYIHYEQAYLFGELDPAFETFTVWELRNAVNSDAPDEQLGWGRQCLMNYRPDEVYLPNSQWRYCRIVKTDVSYNTPDWYKETRTYDQILSGGGKCGPRAWYGRFICKSFGIPTWGVRQPGHAAMTRWTTDGWKVCLGAAMKFSTWEGRGGLDFELETQARHALGNDALYMKKVMRLEWFAFLCQESNRSVLADCLPHPDAPWYAIALMQRKRLANSSPSCVRQAFCSSGHNKIQALMDQPLATREALVREEGMIIIPAASTSKPAAETRKIHFPQSFLGGRQLVLEGNSSVEYTLAADMLTETPTKYKLSCRICTVHRHEDPLLFAVTPNNNKNGSTVSVEVPYTMGMWQETDPVIVEIGGPGVTSTKLTMTRQTKKFAISIKDFKLVPV